MKNSYMGDYRYRLMWKNHNRSPTISCLAILSFPLLNTQIYFNKDQGSPWKKGKNLVCVFIFQMCGKWSVSRGTTIASSIFILFLKSDIGMQILAEEINILKKKIAKLNFGIQSRQWWWWPTTNKKRFFANFIMMIRMDPTIAKIVQASYR